MRRNRKPVVRRGEDGQPLGFDDGLSSDGSRLLSHRKCEVCGARATVRSWCDEHMRLDPNVATLRKTASDEVIKNGPDSGIAAALAGDDPVSVTKRRMMENLRRYAPAFWRRTQMG